MQASAETLAVTTLGRWQAGTAINLERALKAGDELGGHLVSGHIDGVAQVAERRPEGASIRLSVDVPPPLARFIAAKGSIAIDGVSLTVNGVAGERVEINIIDHTARHTTLGALRPGDPVNVEIDMLARYVARLLDNL